MTMVRFHKMHGAGNDFIIIDGRDQHVALSSQKIRQLADRHRGIGCDQLILLNDSDHADIHMQIYNADGSEVGACGNATRCVVALMGRDVSIETQAGLLHGEFLGDEVTVNMGRPRLEWDKIPLDVPMDTLHMPVGWDDYDGFSNPAAVNMGNPHVIFFVENVDNVPLDKIGAIIENDPLFPEKVNVNIAHLSDDGVTLRVWERGAGLTEACGTGACATAVAAIRRGLVTSPVAVDLPGGRMTIDWREGADVMMTGPVDHVFIGEIRL